jgi:hypothetical protein
VVQESRQASSKVGGVVSSTGLVWLTWRGRGSVCRLESEVGEQNKLQTCMRDAKCVVGRREKTSRCFLLYFCHAATITHTHTLHRRLPAYCYCTLDHPPAQLDQPSLSLSLPLSQHLEPMTAHMLAASLPAATKTKGCRSVNPFIRIHARILLQSLSSISPTTGPIRRPQCSSFAKDLDYSAVGSLEVAKPCCHRSTARHHLVAERRGVNANVYQTGVCQFSDTKTRHDTKGSNTCNIQQQE